MATIEYFDLFDNGYMLFRAELSNCDVRNIVIGPHDDVTITRPPVHEQVTDNHIEDETPPDTYEQVGNYHDSIKDAVLSESCAEIKAALKMIPHYIDLGLDGLVDIEPAMQWTARIC